MKVLDVRKDQVRWMILKDLDAVLEIENKSYLNDPWVKQDFIDHLKNRNCSGVVCVFEEKIVGYFLYEYDKEENRIINLAVDPLHRRKGFAKKMLNFIHNKSKNKDMLTLVSDKELPNHLFLSAVGFKAIKIEKNYFEIDHHGYIFSLPKGEMPSSMDRNKKKDELCQGK
jgi:[ribosomal protein S18]-alanine N-acetyltransferase